jgi:integrase
MRPVSPPRRRRASFGAETVFPVSLFGRNARRRSDRRDCLAEKGACAAEGVERGGCRPLLDRAAEEANDGALDAKAQASALRNRALLELLYATGLRVSELVSLPVSVAWRNEPFFMVRGKGGKERMVPVTEKARAAILNIWRRATAIRAPTIAPGCFRRKIMPLISPGRFLRAN